MAVTFDSQGRERQIHTAIRRLHHRFHLQPGIVRRVGEHRRRHCTTMACTRSLPTPTLLRSCLVGSRRRNRSLATRRPQSFSKALSYTSYVSSSPVHSHGHRHRHRHRHSHRHSHRHTRRGTRQNDANGKAVRVARRTSRIAVRGTTREHLSVFHLPLVGVVFLIRVGLGRRNRGRQRYLHNRTHAGGYNGIEYGPTHGNTPSWLVHVARPTVSSSVVVAVPSVSVVAPTPHHPPLRLRQLHHDRKQRGRSVVVVAAGEAGCGRCLAAWSVLVAHESTHAATHKHTCTDTGTR